MLASHAARQFAPAADIRSDRRHRSARRHLEEPARGGFSLVVEVAAQADVHVGDLVALADGHGNRSLRRLGIKALQIRLELSQLDSLARLAA